jgi:hypothetical protein
MIDILPLPCDLPAVAAVVGSDPDGETERAAWDAARRGDIIGACRLALTIVHPERRRAWLANFRKGTIDAAELAAAQTEARS